MTQPERIKDLLHQQEQRAPDSDSVMRSIRTSIARRQMRKRRARTGAIALGVAAAITVPVVTFGGHLPTRLPDAGRPAGAPLATTAGPSTGDWPPGHAAASTSASTSVTKSTAPSPGRTTAPSPGRTTALSPTSTITPTPRASSTASPTTHTSWQPSKNLLDPRHLPPGIMPAGWTFYGAQGDVLVWGVTPTRDDAAAVAKLRIGTWTPGRFPGTCAGLPAKAVGTGQDTAYIAMRIDATQAYILDLGRPDFDRLTPDQVETWKRAGLDLCGDMVWDQS